MTANNETDSGLKSGASNVTVDENMDDLVNFSFALNAVVVPILFAIIMVVGLTGNTLVVYVVTTRRRLRTVTNLLLLNLAVADLCFVAVVPPFTAYEYVAGELPGSSWPFGDVICRLMHYLVNVTAYVTVYTLATIAAVRYMTVVHGTRTVRIRTRRNIVIVIVALWLVVLAVNVPILGSYSAKLSGKDLRLYDCDIADVETGRRLFTTFFVFAYLLPLVVIGVLSTLIMVHIARAQRSSLLRTPSKAVAADPARSPLPSMSVATSVVTLTPSGGRRGAWKSMSVTSVAFRPRRRPGSLRRCQSNCSGPISSAAAVAAQPNSSNWGGRRSSCRKRQVTRLLILVVVVFAILWLPIHVHLLMAFNGRVPEQSPFYMTLGVLWHFLAYFNSCVNPLIYNHTSKEFRDAFRSVVMCCRCPLCLPFGTESGADSQLKLPLAAGDVREADERNGETVAVGKSSAHVQVPKVPKNDVIDGEDDIDEDDYDENSPPTTRRSHLAVLGRLRPVGCSGPAGHTSFPVVVQLQDLPEVVAS